MSAKDIDTQIRNRIDSFLKEIGDLVRQSALAAVQDALGGGGSGARRAAAPMATPGAAAAKPARAAKRTTKKRGRSNVDYDALRSAIQSLLSNAHDGMRMEQLVEATHHDSYVLRKPVNEMLASGQIRKTGEKRGTKYFGR